MFANQKKHNTHRANKIQLASSSNSKLAAALAVAVLALPACTSDDKGRVRVIDDGKKEETKVTTTDLKARFITPTDNAKVTFYDLTNDAEIATAESKITKLSDTSKVQTDEQKGLEVTLKVDQTKLKKSSLVLLSVGQNDKQTATYSEPTNYTQANRTAKTEPSNIAIPKNKPLLALTQINNATSVSATPITTLAVYRTLARLGWFYDNSELPTPKQMHEFLKDKDNVVIEYTVALSEVIDALGVSVLPEINSVSDIPGFIASSNNVQSSFNNWMTFIAQLNVYKKKHQITSPFYAMAHDLAIDFYDGDLDGRTLNGLKQPTTTITAVSPINVPATEQIGFVETIYKKQFPILNTHEASLLKELTQLGTTLDITSKDAYKRLINSYDNTDNAFFPTANTEQTSLAAPTPSRDGDFIVLSPNTGKKSDAEDFAVKMKVEIIALQSVNSAEFTVVQDPTTKKWSGANIPEPYKKNPNVDLGNVNILSDLIEEGTKLIATNFDKNGKELGKVTLSASNKLNTYSDFNRPLANLKNTYLGVGNKTAAFALSEGLDKKQYINADYNRSTTDLHSVVGKYEGNGCSLTITETGVLTLKAGSKAYTVFLDRELNDSIYRIKDESYMLNVSSTDGSSQTRRFIQVKIENQQPVSANTQIVESANEKPLNNPDASCTFS